MGDERPSVATPHSSPEEPRTMENQPAAPQYVLGRSESESQRLIRQASFVRPSTERIFRKAGIAAGMRVLDVGCGAGDVSFLAAELVGPTGSVVGIDVNPAVLELARRRAAETGPTWVRFEERAIGDIPTTERFDAVVGRCVLLYQADPVLALEQMASHLDAGGLLVVQEPDMSIEVRTRPLVPLWSRVSEWIADTFRRGGVAYDIGSRLYPLFRRAGLPGPSLIQHVTVCGGTAVRPICEHSAEMVRSLLPRMEAFGIATAEEVQVDTLAARLERDSLASESQVTYMPNVAAWSIQGESRYPGV
jgi:SAM-dependent methyltransferase